MLAIKDLSAPEVVVGTYLISIDLADATNSTKYAIRLNVSDPCLS